MDYNMNTFLSPDYERAHMFMDGLLSNMIHALLYMSPTAYLKDCRVSEYFH